MHAFADQENKKKLCLLFQKNFVINLQKASLMVRKRWHAMQGRVNQSSIMCGEGLSAATTVSW